MAADQNGHEEWVGSAYLFLESSMDKVVLSEAYTDPKKKVAIYKALQAALSESGDSPDVLQILKIHCSDPQLIVQLRFCGRLLCGRFLQAYREGRCAPHCRGAWPRRLPRKQCGCNWSCVLVRSSWTVG